MWYMAFIVALCAAVEMCGLSAAPAPVAGEPPPNEAVRVIEVDPAFRGAVPAGSTIRRVVRLENVTEAVLKVRVVAVSCPSLEVFPRGGTIDPRDTIEITLTTQASDVGTELWYTAEIEVLTVGAEAGGGSSVQTVQLEIGYSADVIGFASPRLVHLVVPAWQPADANIWVHRLDGEPVGSVIASTPGDWLASIGFKVSRSRPFEGRLTLRSAAGPPAHHYGVVKTQDAAGTHFNAIFVSLRVIPTLHANPTGLVLLPDATGAIPDGARTVHLLPTRDGVEPAKAIIRDAAQAAVMKVGLSQASTGEKSWNLTVNATRSELSDHGTALIDVLDGRDRLLVTVPVVWFSRSLDDLVEDSLKE